MKTLASTSTLEALAKATGGKIVTATKAKPSVTKSTTSGVKKALVAVLTKYRFEQDPTNDQFLSLDLPNATNCTITLRRDKPLFMLEIIREDIDIHIVKDVPVSISEKRIKEIVAYIKAVSLINPVKLPKFPKFL